MKKLTDLLLFLAITVTSQAYSQSKSSENLEVYLQETNNFSAQFKQTIFGRKTNKSSGSLVMSKPDKFSWNYQKPNEQTIVSNGQEVFFYDKDLQQVTVYDQRDLVGNTAAIILNAGSELKRNFQITRESKSPAELREFKGSEFYRLKPIKNQKEFHAIWLVMDKQLVAVLLESDKQKTLLTFSDIQRNRPLDSNTFNFVIPKNVDIIHN